MKPYTASVVKDSSPSLKGMCFVAHINAHHHALIAPFPKSLVESEDIPVAKDPEGFDRIEFLNNINSEIINAMKFD